VRYCEALKNITISLPDEIYRKARIKAAERHTSVSALVRELLSELASEGSDFERRKSLQEAVIASIRTFRAGDRLSRQEVYDRSAVR
jgi:plasmid stability protein